MYSLKEYLSNEIFKGKKFTKLDLLKARLLDASADAIYLLRSYLVWSYNKKHKLRRIIYRRALIKKYGIFISPNTRIGIGLKLPHPQGIVFGSHVIIGDNATIYQQVTFGGKNKGDAQLKNYPRIGSGCIFFTGSKILGNIIVADNTITGANSVLIRDTVENEVYVGLPSKRLVDFNVCPE